MSILCSKHCQSICRDHIVGKSALIFLKRSRLTSACSAHETLVNRHGFQLASRAMPAAASPMPLHDLVGASLVPAMNHDSWSMLSSVRAAAKPLSAGLPHCAAEPRELLFAAAVAGSDWTSCIATAVDPHITASTSWDDVSRCR